MGVNMDRSVFINKVNLGESAIITSVDSPEKSLGGIEYLMRKNLTYMLISDCKYCHVEHCIVREIPLIVIHFENSKDRISFKVDLSRAKQIKELVVSILQECEYLVFKNKYDWSKFLNIGDKFLINCLLTQTSIEDLELAIMAHAQDNLEGPFYNKQQFINEVIVPSLGEIRISDYWEVENDGKLYYQPRN
jgi:hypothetical protein